ncbi:hypothetical protein BKA81DRAFT_100067 [Phyllosticta paracitricarpa]
MVGARNAWFGCICSTVSSLNVITRPVLAPVSIKSLGLLLLQLSPLNQGTMFCSVDRPVRCQGQTWQTRRAPTSELWLRGSTLDHTTRDFHGSTTTLAIKITIDDSQITPQWSAVTKLSNGQSPASQKQDSDLALPVFGSLIDINNLLCSP